MQVLKYLLINFNFYLSSWIDSILHQLIFEYYMLVTYDETKFIIMRFVKMLIQPESGSPLFHKNWSKCVRLNQRVHQPEPSYAP